LTTDGIETATAFALLKAMIEIPSDEIIAKIYVEWYLMEACEPIKGMRTITDSPEWAEFTHEKKIICIFVNKTKTAKSKV
jgi:hypothetical protein